VAATYSELKRTRITFNELLKKYDDYLTAHPNQRLDLYIDTPFCMEVCKFCNCRPVKGVVGSPSYYQYFNYLHNLIEATSDLLKKFPPTDIYFGGGTPVFTDSKMLQTTFDKIPNFKGTKNKAIEIHPALLSDGKAKLLKDYGFNYLSLGVQTFNSDILKDQTRYPFDIDKVNKVLERFRNTDTVINCDIITYLNEVSTTALKQFQSDLQTCKDLLNPDLITCQYNFYNLNTRSTSDQEYVDLDEHTLDAVRRFRAEMVKFCRKNNILLDFTPKEFLSEEHIIKTLKLTPPIYLNSKRNPTSYSCTGFPHYSEEEVAIGLGGYENHICYGHIGKEFNYEMHLVNGEPIIEELNE
jgi:coproporphyrinogen III oxidase-like Fe-S oxidoreductase